MFKIETLIEEGRTYTSELDTEDEIYDLELRSRAKLFIERWLAPGDKTLRERALAPLLLPRHYVEYINNQTFERVLDVFLICDSQDAWKKFKSLPTTTFSEEMLFLLNEVEFQTLRNELRLFLAHEAAELRLEVKKRLGVDGQIPWNDVYQFSTRERRSLSNIRDNGIVVFFDPQAIRAIKTLAKYRNSYRPLLERLKNEKIVRINGFVGSKMSLLVHDYSDHFWTFDLIDRLGILNKYQDLFDRIGNPQSTDIFKREGEIVASIAFGVRLFQTIEAGFEPLISTQEIIRVLENYLILGRLGENHLEALSIIYSLRPNTREWLSLGFVFSNYVVELNEQRRKHGKIKSKNLRTGNIEGELGVLDPDYICLFIEIHHQLLLASNKHRDNLYRLHLVLEDTLERIAENTETDDSYQLILTPELLLAYEFEKALISGEKMKWMLVNYGFTATKETEV